MRKIFFIIFVAPFFNTLVYSQNIPNGQVVALPTVLINPLPAGYANTALYNYTRVWDVKMPSNSIAQIVQSNQIKDVLQSTDYTDGMGKAIQNVMRGITPSGKDFVSPKIYDNVGRESLMYLPYPSTTSDGKIKSNPFSEQAAYMQSQYAGEQVYYSKIVFDNSPLSGVEKTMQVGNSWAGSNRASEAKYESNGINEVKIWSVLSASNSIPTAAGFYDPASLYRGITIDVNGKRTVTYKDKEGRLLLKKVEIATNASSALLNDYPGWLSTYYVYDDVANLRYTITPRAVEWLIQNSWALMPANIIDNLCYRYEYDDKKRLIISQSPGAKEVCSVFDTKDRAVLFRDGNLLTNGKWQYTVYDNQNRVIEKGLWNNSQTRAYHQTQADNSINYPTTLSNNEVLEQIYYDDYSSLNSCGCGLPTSFDITQLTGNWLNTSSSNTYPYPQALIQSQQTLNLTTVSKTKVLNSSPVKYLYSVVFYDKYSNIIQSYSTNITGGKDVVTNQYGFDGKILAIHTQHTYIGIAGTQIHDIYSRLEYDDVGRVLKSYKRIDNDVEKIQTNNTYNEQSQLLKTELGKNPYAPGPIETVDYTYTMKGSLKGINELFVNGSSNNRFFGEIINKEYGFTQPQFNDNIAGVQWRSLGDGERRAFGYTYDPAGRILNAEFTQYNGGWNNSANIDFSQKLGDGITPSSAYDANGNIIKMSQKALLLYQSSLVDNLTYQYENNNYSNKLLAVSDNATAGSANTVEDNLIGDFKDNQAGTPTNDYAYDDNGNIISDYNKSITAITYNHFNKPTQITILGKGTIKYTYDAIGAKLQKIILPNTGPNITYNYIGGFTYRDEQLQYIFTEQGRIRPRQLPVPSGQPLFAYDYFEKDHLGNIRTILTDEKRENFYPKATLEAATIANEAEYYDNTGVGQIARPGAFGTASNNGQIVQLLRKNTQSIGMGKLMKVMVKDIINVRVEYYFPAQTTDNSAANGANSLINTLLSLFALPSAPAALAGKGVEITQQLDNSPSNPFNTFLAPQGSTQPSSLPKAYLNILFFDEQFRFVSQNSLIVGVTIAGSLQQIIRTPEAPKNGYVYIYVSNESNNLVYFDNLQVAQIRSQVLEENHYNLFGAKMTGLCSKANPSFANSLAFQGKHIDEEFDLDWNDFGARAYDAQIGRFMQLDPADQFASGYVGMGNSWTNGTDPTGAVFGYDDLVVAAVGFVYGYVSSGIKNGNWGAKALGNGLLQAAIFEVGYLTAGGGLAATGGASAATAATSTTAAVTASAASTTAMNTAGTYLINTGINIAIGTFLPSIPLEFGSLTINISPALSTGGVGVNIAANYKDGNNVNIGISFGFGKSFGTQDLSGHFAAASKGIYSVFGSSFGVRVNSTDYAISGASHKTGGTASQTTGVWGLQIGDFALRIDEDFFPLGDGNDRHYTGGGTATYKLNSDISLGIGLSMITGEANKGEGVPYSKGKKNHASFKHEITSSFRGGALYGGVIYKGQAYFGGINSEKILHAVQNTIHNWVGTPYFPNMGYKAKPWGYMGNYNLTSIIY